MPLIRVALGLISLRFALVRGHIVTEVTSGTVIAFAIVHLADHRTVLAHFAAVVLHRLTVFITLIVKIVIDNIAMGRRRRDAVVESLASLRVVVIAGLKSRLPHGLRFPETVTVVRRTETTPFNLRLGLLRDHERGKSENEQDTFHEFPQKIGFHPVLHCFTFFGCYEDPGSAARRGYLGRRRLSTVCYSRNPLPLIETIYETEKYQYVQLEAVSFCKIS